MNCFDPAYSNWGSEFVHISAKALLQRLLKPIMWVEQKKHLELFQISFPGSLSAHFPALLEKGMKDEVRDIYHESIVSAPEYFKYYEKAH
jgi:hypothetical protein